MTTIRMFTYVIIVWFFRVFGFSNFPAARERVFCVLMDSLVLHIFPYVVLIYVVWFEKQSKQANFFSETIKLKKNYKK